jgi:hypothetical protein
MNSISPTTNKGTNVKKPSVKVFTGEPNFSRLTFTKRFFLDKIFIQKRFKVKLKSQISIRRWSLLNLI